MRPFLRNEENSNRFFFGDETLNQQFPFFLSFLLLSFCFILLFCLFVSLFVCLFVCLFVYLLLFSAGSFFLIMVAAGGCDKYSSYYFCD